MIRPHPAAILAGPHLKTTVWIGERPAVMAEPLEIVAHASWPWAWLQPVGKQSNTQHHGEQS